MDSLLHEMLICASRAAVALAAGLLLALCLRRASAAARHFALALAVCAALFAPLLSLTLPPVEINWRASVPASITNLLNNQPDQNRLKRNPSGSEAVFQPTPQADAQAVISGDGGGQTAGQTPWRASVPASKKVELGAREDTRAPGILLTLWALVTLFFLLRLIVGMWRARQFVRRGAPISGEMLACAEDAGRELGMRAPGVLLSADVSSPAACGLWRVRVLLPVAAEGWPKEALRAALLHEFSHARRWDTRTQALCDLLCALYWFNPLAWLAARALRREREAACDDAVLNAGVPRLAYAEVLLDSLRAHRAPAFAGLAMARPQGWTTRLRAIMDHTRNRKPLTRALAAALTLLAIIIAVLVALPGARRTGGKIEGMALPVVIRAEGLFEGYENARAPRAIMSANGRFVLWQPGVELPLEGRKTLPGELLLFDRERGTVELTGVQAEGASYGYREQAFSVDDRGDIAFSTGQPLLAEDENGASDIYLYLREEKRTVWVSRPVKGGKIKRPGYINPIISADGSTIAFIGDATPLSTEGKTPKSWQEICLYDVRAGKARGVWQQEPFHHDMKRSAHPVCEIGLSGDGRCLIYMAVVDREGKPTDLVALYERDKRDFQYRAYGDYGCLTFPTISPDGNLIGWMTNRISTKKLAYPLFEITNRMSGVSNLRPERILGAPRLTNDGVFAYVTPGYTFPLPPDVPYSASTHQCESIAVGTRDGKPRIISGGSEKLCRELALEMAGNSSPSISADGRYVCYVSDMTVSIPLSKATGKPLYSSVKLRRGWAVQVYDSVTGVTVPLVVVTDVVTKE